MLIYNHNKEFIGIDVNDLQQLHYRSFSDLLNNCSDCADLFVKKPGYIHNFKNFNWIDFVMHSDSDESKVLISAKKKTFSATLGINTIYLTDAPAEPAYLVELRHLKSLNDDDTVSSAETFEEPRPIPAQLPEFDAMEPTTLVEPDPLDVPDYSDFDAIEGEQESALYNPKSSFLADTIDLDNAHEAPEIPTFEAPPETNTVSAAPAVSAPSATVSPTQNLSAEEEELLHQKLKIDLHYHYTPQIAADELGLPVDLIEEFIGDFIAQAYEFEEELFASVSDHNFDNIKNLSHKLKGVAANLRIDDSFEVLTLLNTTLDITEAQTYLKYFYNTIAKLGGTKADESHDAAMVPTPLNDEADSSADIDNEPPLSDSLQQESEELYPLEAKEHQEVPVAVAHTDETTQEDELYSFDTLIKRDEALPALEVAVNDNNITAQEPAPTDTNFPAEKTKEAGYREIHYNHSKAACELGIDPDFISELKDDFIAQTLAHKEAFQEALDHDDALRYKTLALELKGVSDNLHIGDISSTLEEVIKSHSTHDAQHSVNQLFHYIKQL